MKKLDIIIIAFVVIIGVTIFALYFDKTNIDTDSAQLGIYYNSQILDDALFLNKDTDLTYHIESSSDMKKLLITKEDHKKGTTIKYEKTASQMLPIGHTIVITYDSIRITEAVCENKDCTRLRMSYKYTNPIVCINGISVMFKEFKPVLGSLQ